MYATTIMESSLALAWQRALEFVLKSPEKLKFGGGKEVKHARDSQVTFLLDSNAVGDALAGITHPLDPFYGWDIDETRQLGAQHLAERHKDFEIKGWTEVKKGAQNET